MNIFFHRFYLKPKIKLNHLSSIEVREGVFLKSEQAAGVGYTEYFPHPELGDLGVNNFLESFKQQKHESQKKALYFLKPEWSRLETNPSFFNHQLFREGEKLESGTIKYKIKDKSDCLLNLPSGIQSIRLDANGLFNMNSWIQFEKKIPPQHWKLIDYIEDPLSDEEWQNIKLPTARDFVKGTPFEVNIYKPYREFFPVNSKRVIFSGNMGHGLSNYQAYLELLGKGNLKDHHGLLTPDLYENSFDIFTGSFRDGFRPEMNSLKKYFEELKDKTWTPL